MSYLRICLAAFFVFAGVMHFIATPAYMKAIPPYLPFPRELVWVSGACEIAGGLGVLFPFPLRRWAGWGLIALLIAVFPANIEIARHGLQLAHTTLSPLWGLLRLPFQLLFLAWVWFCAVVRPAVPGSSSRLVTPHKHGT